MFPHERSLVQRLEGRPFALVGVDVGDDRDSVQREERDGTITWRSLWDEPGALAAQWQATSFPTILLIDHRGVIRQRFAGSPGDETLDRAIEQLVKEAESEQPTPLTASTTSRTTR
jgi:hypothetical protein